MVNNVIKRLAEQDVEVEVTDQVKEIIIKEGYNPEFGARPLRRAIQRNIEDRLSEEMLKNTFAKGDKVIVSCQDGKITVQAVERTDKA